MKFSDNGQVKIAYQERGRGTPVLLIAGYGARSAHWGQEFPDRLAREYRVISFDNRGTGESDKPDEAWTMRDMADDAARVIAAAGATGAHIVGISMGGMIAQELALTHPESALTLTLIATKAGGAGDTPPAPAVHDAFFNPDRSQGVKKMLEGMWRTICTPGFMDAPGRLEGLFKLDLEKPTPPRTLQTQRQAIETSDFSSRLPQLTVPTLIITGREDRLTPPANSRRLAGLIPNSKLVQIEGCAHMIPLEKPQELADTILRFLAGHSR